MASDLLERSGLLKTNSILAWAFKRKKDADEASRLEYLRDQVLQLLPKDTWDERLGADTDA